MDLGVGIFRVDANVLLDQGRQRGLAQVPVVVEAGIQKEVDVADGQAARARWLPGSPCRLSSGRSGGCATPGSRRRGGQASLP